ncbi:MAG TPA: LysM peptidoglycan-binding domain-containing protein [Myxococcales bacterium]|nr:LysM peptidoglycan-binding domain-containing protein [Myxococcales bacterium]
MSYQIKSGDTLSQLAQRFGTSVSALQKANPKITNPDLIYAGDSLNIPGKSDTFGGGSRGGMSGAGGDSFQPGGASPTGGASAPTGPMPKGQVGDWIQQAMQILQQNGVPASKMNAQDIAMIIQHESGGNPNAQNNWDSNAAAGHPSIGLMQTIQPTFDSNKLPGHNDIRNPVDNIIAGVRYAIERYGSTSNVPGVKAVHNGGAYVGY